MVKKTLSAIIAVLLAAAVLASCAKAEKASSAQKQTKSETSPIPQAVTVPQETNSVEQVLASMTTEEKIEQMIMPSIRYNDNGTRALIFCLCPSRPTRPRASDRWTSTYGSSLISPIRVKSR